MRVVNIYQAKTHLSRLVREAVEGDPFIIARAGKPLVKVVSVEAAASGARSRIGFLAGEASSVPDDFNDMGGQEIQRSFEGGT